MGLGRWGRSKRGRVILGIGIGVVVATIFLVNFRSRRARVLEVEAEPVTRGTVIERVKASGKVQP